MVGRIYWRTLYIKTELSQAHAKLNRFLYSNFTLFPAFNRMCKWYNFKRPIQMYCKSFKVNNITWMNWYRYQHRIRPILCSYAHSYKLSDTKNRYQLFATLQWNSKPGRFFLFFCCPIRFCHLARHFSRANIWEAQMQRTLAMENWRVNAEDISRLYIF